MTTYRPTVIVLAGPNGAGKTTVAPRLLRDTLGLVEFVNADTIALGLAGFDPDVAALEAGKVMFDRIRQLGVQRHSFAFETTLASRSLALGLQGSFGAVTRSVSFSSGFPVPSLPYSGWPIGYGWEGTAFRRPLSAAAMIGGCGTFSTFIALWQRRDECTIIRTLAICG